MGTCDHRIQFWFKKLTWNPCFFLHYFHILVDCRYVGDGWMSALYKPLCVGRDRSSWLNPKLIFPSTDIVVFGRSYLVPRRFSSNSGPHSDVGFMSVNTYKSMSHHNNLTNFEQMWTYSECFDLCKMFLFHKLCCCCLCTFMTNTSINEPNTENPYSKEIFD